MMCSQSTQSTIQVLAVAPRAANIKSTCRHSMHIDIQILDIGLPGVKMLRRMQYVCSEQYAVALCALGHPSPARDYRCLMLQGPTDHQTLCTDCGPPFTDGRRASTGTQATRSQAVCLNLPSLQDGLGSYKVRKQESVVARAIWPATEGCGARRSRQMSTSTQVMRSRVIQHELPLRDMLQV